jgi:ADP-ribose pyrophosphatase YjhB (NUDIX family)
MPDGPRHSVSVAGVIVEGDQVLLVRRRDNGNWEPPGGVLELDESVLDGLRREIREETGAAVHVGPLTGVYKNMPLGIIALVFRCGLVSQPSPESAEASEITWFPIGEIRELMPEAFAVRITDAVSSGAPSPPVREHDGRALMHPQ